MFPRNHHVVISFQRENVWPPGLVEIEQITSQIHKEKKNENQFQEYICYLFSSV